MRTTAEALRRQYSKYRLVTTIPFRGLLSGNWIPRNRVEVVGALLIGTPFLSGGFIFLINARSAMREARLVFGNSVVSAGVGALAEIVIFILGAALLFLGLRFVTSPLNRKK